MRATIDLGSNSFRVLTFDEKSGELFGDFEKVVGTAEGLVSSGRISDEAVTRILNAISESMIKLKYEASKTTAITTAAMRYATNSQEVLNTIKQQSGIDFEIIDGDEEARLTLLAIENAIKRENINSDKFIAIDIGGGSTELIIKNSSTVFSKSFEFGIVTLANSSSDLDDAKKILNTKLKELENFVSQITEDLDEYIFVSTAGTPTTIAALKLGMNYFNYDKYKINGTKITLTDIATQSNRISALDEDSVYNLLGARKKRFVEVGILIFSSIYEVLQKKESFVFDDGLREGIMIDYCMKKSCK